jgi:hypothetical protein
VRDRWRPKDAFKGRGEECARIEIDDNDVATIH